MKFNGKNIIFDDDITLMSEGLEGKKLSDVLRGLQSKTSKLESWMKWIYQNGGVGGNGSGGGGSQNGYSLYVTVGGVQVTGGTLNLSSGEDEWYDLVVKAQNPEGATIKISYSYYYKNDTGTKIKAQGSDTLSPSNNYTHTAKICLNCNDSLIIDSQDDLFGIDKQVNCNIITNNYTFNAYLAKENGDEWSDDGRGAEIFTEETGSLEHCNLNIAIDYDVAIAVTTTYNWSFVAKDKVYQGSGTLTQGSPTGGMKKLLIPLIFDNNELDRFMANESDAGYYSVTLSIAVDMSSVGQVSGEPWTKSMTFNLIPQNLYLLVSSTSGTIYTSKNESSDRFEFNPGVIGFHVNSYRGNDGGTFCTIEYRYDDGNWRKKSSTIRTEEDITDVIITKAEQLEGHGVNEHWIDFRLTSLNDQYPQSSSYARYYFYVKPLESKVDYPWDDPNSTRAGTFNTYRNGDQRGETLKSLFNVNGGAPIHQASGSKPIKISDITYPSTGLYTTVINIGLQYSEINSDSNPVFTAIKGNEEETYLTITQNTIKFGTHATVSYYFPKTDYYTFSKTDTTVKNKEYHLLSIVQRLVSKIGNNSLYEITVYVDGVLEGASGNYVSNPLNFKSFTLEPCNCFVNLFDVSYLTWSESSPSGVEDLNIYQYWLKYKSEVKVEPLGEYDVNILSFVDKFSINNNGDILTGDHDAVANIATMAGVPTLVMTINDDKGSALSDINAGYNENDKLTYDVSIEWSDGKNQLAPVMIPNAMPNAQFVASIQGSSTKKYKCKNWNLSLVNRSAEDKTLVPRYLYSPNFSYPTNGSLKDLDEKEQETYTDTFLPEEEFTLKADVVDSSHSNNTSIGRFVNDVTTRFATGQQNKVLGGYVKNCLEGFPIIVYICLSKTVNGATTNKYYYQGVYNFNLGRTSYYNLGYKNIDTFVNGSNVLVGNAGSSFTFYQVPTDSDNIMDGLLVAEIQGNSPYFDFSQYDKSILFNQDENDKEYMFGDIERASQSMTDSEAEDVLSNLVRLTSQAGGYLFENVLRKTISDKEDDMYGYLKGYNATKMIDGVEVPANQVPNYRKNIVKKNVDSGYKFYVGGADRVAASATALGDFLGTDDEDPKPAFFDYQSLSEYYTICMAFGLVDSVQKNMNIKSWDADGTNNVYKGKFYAAFYDMDTCLGINNAGKDTTYFAFSDYWDHDDSDVSSDGTVTPKPIEIYRDYSPKNKIDEEGGGDYYDTASSYLFAIAKYAIYSDEFKNSPRTQYWPKRLWALWRSTSTGTGLKTAGCLSSAKKFMSNYFQNNLGKVSIPLINMNYRNKYFVFTSNKEDEANSFSKRNFAMFNGTRIHKAEDWLNGRFHILDAYFNLPDANSSIQYYDEADNFVDVPNGNGALTEPVTKDWGYNLEANPDITVLRDIFAQDQSSNSGSGTIDARVKAREFTPLFISSSTKAFRYLLSANTTYKIYQDLSGLQEFKFGGSSNWVELNSINTFPFSSLSVNSKYLENLSGSQRTLTIDGANIDMPSLKNLILTGKNYTINFTGKGQISNRFPNLVEVNFSNVGSCNAIINGSKFTTLSIGGIQSGSIEVNNCEDMTKLNMGSGTQTEPSPKLSKLLINPVSEGIRKLSWSRTAIKSIQLINESTRGDSSFSLQYDESVDNISLAGFSKVDIRNCPNLKSITISDSDSSGDKLTSVTILNCGTKVSEFHINSDENGVVDFTKCKYLKYCGGLSGMTNITDVRFCKDATADSGSTTVEVVGSCFQNDINLKYLSGSQIVITGSGTFQNCNAFTMKEDENSITNLYVKAGVTSLNSMFSCSSGSNAISLATIKTFMEGGSSHWANPAAITSMSGMFYGQYGIKYTEANLASDLKGGSIRLDLRAFKGLSDVTSMFAWSGMSAYHPDTLGFGENVDSISFTNFSIGVSTIAVCPSSFKNIIYKITGIGPTDSNYTNGLLLLNSSGARVTSANLRDYFITGGHKPEKVTTLRGLYVNSACTNCSLASLFGGGGICNWPALTSIYTTFKDKDQNIYKGVTEAGVSTLNVTYFYESFNISNATINLFTFFNWDVVLSSGVPFANRQDSYSAYNIGCINMKKLITMSDLKTLWTKILNSNLTSLNYLFWNCSVTGADSSDLTTVFGASGGAKNTRITTMASAFRNFSITRSGATASTPIVIGHFLSIFPNATNFTMCFRDTSIGKALPRDFFGKRQKDNANSRSGSIYFTKSEPVAKEKTLGNDKVTKIWASDNDSIFEEGSVTKFNYKQAELKLAYMFYNVTWKRYGDGGSNDITNSAKRYNFSIDDTDIKGNYFEIGSVEYSDGDGGYQKRNGSTAYYVKESYTYNVVTGQVENADGTMRDVYEAKTEQYYEIENTVVTGDENTEISDLIVPDSDHVNEFIALNGTTKLYNSNVDDPSKLFIAPDFLYAVSNTSKTELSNLFGAGDVANENRLEGMIPEHFLKNCKSVSFGGLFSGLNITPRKWKTFGKETAYVYVPQNFTSYATLNGAFNFNLNVPAAASENNQYNKYYVMFKNSIPKETTTLSDSLPSSWPGQSGTWVNFGANGDVLGTHYNIMVDQNSSTEPIQGIDVSYFSSLRFNKLVNGKLSWVLDGNLFNSSFYLENLRMNTNGSDVVSDYVIYTTTYAQNSVSISRGLVLPSTGTNNLSDINLISFGTTGGLTISRSQIEGCNDSMASAYQTIRNLSAGSNSYIHVIG